MKAKRKSFSTVLIILAVVAALVAALSTVAIYESSTITVTSPDGEVSSVYTGISDRSSVVYEDSDVFSHLFIDSIFDITRMCVIRNQMETSGSYDADKKIDIETYADRSRLSFASSAQGTGKDSSADKVEYRLDDLVKWGNYGYDVIPVTGTEVQLDAYFYSLINGVAMNDVATEGERQHREAGDAEYLFNEENVFSEDELTYTEYVLVERYKSTDKKSITQYVSNRKEYKALVRSLLSSSSDLFTNYNEYVKFSDKYGAGKTNVLYCYQMHDASGKMLRYSNLGGDVSSLTNDELSKKFTAHPKYVCFNPDKLQAASSIDTVDSSLMRNALSGYEYSFGDGSRIWLAFDENYPAQDIFATARDSYSRSSNAVKPAIMALIVSIIAFILLFVMMTVLAGRVQITDENGEKTMSVKAEKIDKIPIELYAAAVLLIALFFCEILMLIYDEAGQIYREIPGGLYIAGGCFAVGFSAIMLTLYLIFVRKIKCGLMWNGSILKWLVEKIKKGVSEVYDHGHLTVRVWLPYLLFLAFNLVLVLLGPLGIFIAFVADIVIGIWLYKEAKTRNDIVAGISRISEGEIGHKVDTTGMHGDNLDLANAVNNIGDGISKAVATSMRDEKMKADLITNVSHDIKTPLTSIINYVDLLKRENIEDEKIKGYVDILDQKSQRLKQLTDDLVEASKISSGNISLNIEKLNFVELIHQSIGEFSEKFEEKGLKTILDLPAEPVYIMADSRGIYRVVENLYNNIYKYAMENTRVYVDMVKKEGSVELAIKNISADVLNISIEELTERFMRGDESRKTEGSGLGLSIAKSLTEAMGGKFNISLDGDLFKVVIAFDAV